MSRRRKASRALDHMSAVLTASSAGLPAPQPRLLIDWLSQFAWDEIVIRLAVLNAVMSNHGGPEGELARSLTVGLFLRSDPAKMTPAGRLLLRHIQQMRTTAVIASEAGTLFLQALAIVHGKDVGPAPSDGQLTEMLVVANEYAFDWLEDDPRQLTLRERTVADTSRALTFNRREDPARQIVRSYQMMRPRPTRFWNTDESWHELQRRAFGIPIEEYMESYVLPLVAQTVHWGTPRDETFAAPIINPSSWWRETRVDPSEGEAFLRSLASTRGEAREALVAQTRADGFVLGPTVFYRKPGVVLPDGQIAMLSPALVREQLRGGLWGKHRGAVGDGGNWPHAFGDLFEDWCQRAAAIAKPNSVDEITIPATRGTDDEIEDILIRKNNAVVFISVKASTIPEFVMRGARSRHAVLEWFDRFLFAGRGRTGDGQQHGGGAIRRLDAKISALRRGEYESRGLPKTLRVYPLVVAYEHGFDSPSVYHWCMDRCRELGLLAQDRVAAITFAGVEDLEALLALGITRRQSAVDILRQKTGEQWRLGRFDILLHERTSDDLDLRLPQLTDEFEVIMQRCRVRVFGRAT